jgi:transaldolase
MEEVIEAVRGLPLSLEVTTNNLNEMIEQAQTYKKMYPQVAVKIPVQTQNGELCYGVIHELEEADIRVNATVCLSFGQVILAAKAGATYISIFAGRIGDEGGNPPEVIKNSVEWLTRWKYKSEIIVGSIRSVKDVLDAVIAGAHILTIPPEILVKMGNHMFTRETVRQFVADAQK